jgi:hypothetical protein
VAVNAFNTFKPIQGFFTNVESGHVEDRLAQFPVFSCRLLQLGSHCDYQDQPNGKAYGQPKFIIVRHFHYFPTATNGICSLNIM